MMLLLEIIAINKKLKTKNSFSKNIENNPEKRLTKKTILNHFCPPFNSSVVFEASKLPKGNAKTRIRTATSCFITLTISYLK